MSAPIGVLAVQGGFAPHAETLRRIGARPVEVRTAAQLEAVSALVMPGGESSAMLTLLGQRAMLRPLQSFARSGRPVLATCAGLILAAHPDVGWLDISVQRNAYGNQQQSFVARSDDGAHELVFIRAPQIRRVGPGVEVLARHRGHPVLVRQGTVVAATFHPELTPATALHETLLACR